MADDSRRKAGRQLAADLREYEGSDAVVLGLSRGGVVVGHEIAQVLRLPFDVLVVHKIMEPGSPHRHIGVVAEPSHVAVQNARLRSLALAPEWLEDAVAHGVGEVRHRGGVYRGARARQELAGRHVILVDDSAATGTTLRAAVTAVQALGPRAIVVALPVAPRRVVAALQRQVNRVVCLAAPTELITYGIHYPTPGGVTDDEIRQLLEQRASVDW